MNLNSDIPIGRPVKQFEWVNVRKNAAAADGVMEDERQVSEGARLRSDAVQHVSLPQEEAPAALRRLVQGGAQRVGRRRRL